MRIAFLFAVALQAQEFRPVEPELLSRTIPKVDKDADAEAVFWDVTMAEGSRVQLDHYIRIKIYTEYGCEKHGRIDLIIPRKTSISDVAGRTIQPNGDIIPLDRSGVFEREIVRMNKMKLRALSFAMPGVEPGAVIEYRWKEKRSGTSLHHQRLELQRSLPVWSVTYRVKPNLEGWRSLDHLAFQTRNVKFARDDEKGYYRLNVENVPAFEEEPHSIPEASVRAWVLLKYRSPQTSHPAFGWQSEFLAKTKPGKQVTQTAKELVSGVTGDREKLERLARFCRTKVRNLRYDPGATAADLERAAKIKDAEGTLAAKLGSGDQVNLLFAALVRAAGFEASLAGLTERDLFLPKGTENLPFDTATNIAVLVDGKYLFFDPATPFVEDGMLRWQEEKVTATFVDGMMLQQVQTPLSAGDRSRFERTAKLALSADGSVEGEVRTTWTGHPGVEQKLAWAGLTTAEIAEMIERDVAARLPSAEVSGIEIMNAADPLKPPGVTYKIRVPDYAYRVGDRLFVPFAFFHRGVPPRFEAATRMGPMYFPYPWREEDQVTYTLAAGQKADPPSLVPPGGLSIPGIGSYECTVRPDPSFGSVHVKRSFEFGKNGAVAYDAPAYPSVKRIFDMLHDRDSQVFEVRLTPAGVSQ